MKLVYFSILLLIVIIVVYACKSPRKTSELSSRDTHEELFTFEAGKCFGRCKVYQLKVFESGKAELIAIKNIEELGKSTLYLSNDKLHELSLLFEKSSISQLNEEYLSGARDLQKFKLSYKNKTIAFHKMKAPQELLSILNTLNSLVEEQEW